MMACLAGIKTNCRACEDSPPPRHSVEVSEWRLGSVLKRALTDLSLAVAAFCASHALNSKE
ncbi:hypothetical protein NC653_026508 [Populus alba x Populus x berolinensis]|uniref:Uncharacterized protein n=1 Tax=Populus alba x Populus x berolinensis TaxID=444605 RepID=A0AAD6MEN8_9ROSI|nr:hypothetical protein NC653_026508 [Populus alba x Populus x berolinensis]